MMTYLVPLLVLCGCGILAGVLLTVAAKVFYVKVDDRIKQIDETLPQANCGACGYAGCADYANATINDGAEPNLCLPEELLLRPKSLISSVLRQMMLNL